MSDSTSSSVPGWLWLIAGVALGALVMFLMRLSELDSAMSYFTSLDRPSANNDVAADQDNEAPKGRSFDFYRLLKDTEVAVTAKPADASAQTSEMDYLLQVASFQSATDANEVRAQLTLLNLSSWIEKSQSQNGVTWHRVIVGPFRSRSQMAKAKSTLLNNRFDALMLKRERVSPR